MGRLLLNQNKTSLAKNAGAVLYLDARKSNGYSIPANLPLTNPWVDLSGNSNNATPTNMAGTTASGTFFTDPIRPFWILDGSDDFFSLLNAASIDITAAPLAVFATIKVNPAAIANGYIFSKNATLSTDVQYGLYWNFTNNLVNGILEGSTRGGSAASSVPANVWKNVGFIWDGTNVKYYVNGIGPGVAGLCSGALTSRANARIGRRETAASYFVGNIATLSIYAGSKATETNILKAEKAISKAYIGG